MTVLFHVAVTTFCGAFSLNGPAGINLVNVQPFDLVANKTRGVDIEASCQWQRPLGIDGGLSLRGLATHVRKFVTDTELPGTVPIDAAGANSGATSDWKVLAIETWTGSGYPRTLQQRWFSDGVFGNRYVVCAAPNCRVSTVNSPTIDRNDMPGSFYFDVGGSVDLASKVTACFKVDNLFNKDSEPSPQANTGIDINPALYDTLSGVYRIGLRCNF